jgi:hypothetical protein
MQNIEQQFRPKIFRYTAVRNFLTKLFAHTKPDFSISAKSIDYYQFLFV